MSHPAGYPHAGLSGGVRCFFLICLSFFVFLRQ